MMATNTLSFDKLFSDANTMTGRTVRTSCLLTVEGDEARLTGSEESSVQVIKIRESNFIDRLLDSTPCYVGGQYLYQDPVVLEVVVEIDEKGIPFIVKVISGELERDGETFEF